MSDFLTLEAFKMAPNRRMCNELVRELCKEIPTVKTSNSILLTARNMYAYLAPIFCKKLIYRDAIAFLRAKLKAKKIFIIWIGKVAQKKENGPIVINQDLDNEFKLETNHFRVRIRTNDYPKGPCSIMFSENQFENVHLYYFLRLIAPLIQPLQLYADSTEIPIAALVRFMNTHSDWIDSIRLWNEQFNTEEIYGPLSKYNKLQIIDHLSPFNVPILIQWLNSNNNNNGQPKKCLFLCNWNNNGLDGGLALLMDELKKEFALATSKSRFVVHLELRQQLDEFTVCNELTGEILELRFKNYKDNQYIHALSRSPDNGLDDNENDSAELDTFTQIYMR